MVSHLAMAMPRMPTVPRLRPATMFAPVHAIVRHHPARPMHHRVMVVHITVHHRWGSHRHLRGRRCRGRLYGMMRGMLIRLRHRRSRKQHRTCDDRQELHHGVLLL